MADSIEEYRETVREKEEARASLIGKIVRAQEEERKHVARELHDQLGQSLSHTLIKVKNACRDEVFPEVLGAVLEKDLQGHIDEVHRLSWDMRPALLDDYGLDSALKRYLEEASKRAEIPVEYERDSPQDLKRLPSETEVTLFRVAQEAVTKVLRHAEPSRISVLLVCQDSQVTLVIEDNGRGFDSVAVEGDGSSSLGLLGMRERVALIGGSVEIESVLGQGTEVFVTIPTGESQRAHTDRDR